MARSTQYKLSAIIGLVDRMTSPARRMAANTVRAFSKIGSGISGAVRFASHLTTSIWGIGQAVRGATSFITDYSQEIDELAKTSRRLQLTTEALSELRHAADLSGVSAEDLTSAFQTMNKAVGEARLRKGRLYTLLRQVSPEMLKLVQGAESADEAFTQLVGAAKSIQDPIRRNLLLVNAFGLSGSKMATLVESGADGLASMRAEARRLGIVVDGETAAAAEKFNDDLTRLNRVIDGVKLAIGSELVPVLDPLVEKTTEWLRVNRDVIGTNVSGWVSDAAGFIQNDLWPAIKSVAELSQELLESWREFQRFIRELKDDARELIDMAGEVGGAATRVRSVQIGQRARRSVQAQLEQVQGAEGFQQFAAQSVRGDSALARRVQSQLQRLADQNAVQRVGSAPKTSFTMLPSLRDALTKDYQKAFESARFEELRKLQNLDPAEQARQAGLLANLIGDFRAAEKQRKLEIDVNFSNAPANVSVARPRAEGVEVTTRIERNTGRSTLLESPL